MNLRPIGSVVETPMQMEAVARIVAIERDRECGRALRARVREWANADVVIVSTASAALRAVAEMVPDLILISATTAPADDESFTARLRAVPAGRHLPILSVPPLVDDRVPAPASGGALRHLLGHRRLHPWPPYDADALGARLRAALQPALASRGHRQLLGAELVASGVVAGHGPDTAADVLVAELTINDLQAQCGLGAPQPRAQRWTGAELPWLSQVRWPWGVGVRLLNISSTGLLIESEATLSVGRTTEFQLLAGTSPLAASARVVRSVPVGSGDRRLFHTAASFDRELAPMAPRPAPWQAAYPMAPSLARVWAEVRAESRRGASAERLQTWFELGLQELLGARDVRLTTAVVQPTTPGEVEYFAVAAAGHRSVVVRATFEPDRGPTDQALQMLSAAAPLAADLLVIEQIHQ